MTALRGLFTLNFGSLCIALGNPFLRERAFLKFLLNYWHYIDEKITICYFIRSYNCISFPCYIEIEDTVKVLLDKTCHRRRSLQAEFCFWYERQ